MASSIHVLSRGAPTTTVERTVRVAGDTYAVACCTRFHLSYLRLPASKELAPTSNPRYAYILYPSRWVGNGNAFSGRWLFFFDAILCRRAVKVRRLQHWMQ